MDARKRVGGWKTNDGKKYHLVFGHIIVRCSRCSTFRKEVAVEVQEGRMKRRSNMPRLKGGTARSCAAPGKEFDRYLRKIWG